MDPVTILQRNPQNKKENKENTQPLTGAKIFNKTSNTTVVPFQLTGNKKSVLNKSDPFKGNGKQVDKKPVSRETQTKLQRDVKGASTAIRRPILKPTFTEVPKPSSKSAPGMYKGRIVQSKIGSIWKSSDTLGLAISKPPAPKAQNEKVINTATKIRSKSVEVSKQVTKRPVSMRSNSVSDKPSQVTRPAASNCRPTGFCSAQPPTRTVTANLPSTTSKITTLAPIRSVGNQNTKTKIQGTDKKSGKPVVSSTLSQYRATMETTEEKRAKLAEWLASKGKALKRPAMTNIVPPKTKVSTQMKVNPKVPENVELQLASLSEAEPSWRAHDLEPETDAPPTEVQREETGAQTSGVMNTTLDLLDESDVDPTPELQGGVDDIVVNLCDALEAMVTPSRSSNDGDTPCDQPDEHKSKKCQVKVQREESDVTDQEVKPEDAESEDNVIETPQTDASVIKYSVKTTPYLQSVKKTIEDEVDMCTSRRKSKIKDLKFLTPVRRSSRIQQISTHLPSMLTDHDPCVSSLAELVKLDDDPNAYIYRKNPALLQELPDQTTL